MINSELKLDLIQKIIDTNDIDLLMELKDLLDIFFNEDSFVNEPSAVYEKTEKVRVFNEWEQARIDKALKQIENGEFISDEEAQIEIEKWFEEQEK
jgi:predicted transcriptional regulator